MNGPLEIANRLQARTFRLLPTRLISRTWGKFTRTSASKHLIRPFVQTFKVDTREAEKDLSEYPTLNAFFTRKLKKGYRPIDEDPSGIISPVDGSVSASGICDQDRLMQIKGFEYTLFGLLRDGPMANRFIDGTYTTLYLSPRDYHRVHAPLDMEISGIGYMPGTLMPVNGPSVRWVEQLYTQNERLIIYARTSVGMIAVVLVGAHCVGSISLSFHDLVTNSPGRGPARLEFERSVEMKKGDELGMFQMGSTVVVLFEKGRVELALPQLGMPVRLGQKIASIVDK